MAIADRSGGEVLCNKKPQRLAGAKSTLDSRQHQLSARLASESKAAPSGLDAAPVSAQNEGISSAPRLHGCTRIPSVNGLKLGWICVKNPRRCEGRRGFRYRGTQ